MRIRAFSHRTTPPALLACLLVVAGAALGGCAAPATVDGMSVGPGDLVTSPASFPLAGTLAVGDVTGGEETNPMWTPEVGNDAFREALVERLQRFPE